MHPSIIYIYLSVRPSAYLSQSHQHKNIKSPMMHKGLRIFVIGNHLGHGLNISKWNDSPRLSQQTPMERTHPAPSSSLWKLSCLLNEIIKPYEMCVISGEQIFVNESGGLYSRSVLTWNLPDIIKWKGKEELMNWLGVQRFDQSPRAGQCPAGLTLSKTSMSP